MVLNKNGPAFSAYLMQIKVDKVAVRKKIVKVETGAGSYILHFKMGKEITALKLQVIK